MLLGIRAKPYDANRKSSNRPLFRTACEQEGIVPAATNLSKLDDEDSMRACATVFALLSADPRGRAKFVQRKSALVSLFDLLRSTDQGTQVICGKVNSRT